MIDSIQAIGEKLQIFYQGSTVEILHIFVNSKETPSISKANKLIDKLNNKKINIKFYTDLLIRNELVRSSSFNFLIL